MKKTNDRYYIIINIVALLLCLVAAFIMCTKKQGFHVDEYYSYYSSNRTEGLYITDKTWMDSDVITKELSVVNGEGFNFGLVKEVQSWDVHPPVYYYILHLVCSLTPGKFTMWQGLAINLICMFIALILVRYLAGLVMSDMKIVPVLVTCIWGLSAGVMTGVVFIRMYMLLTVWIAAVTILHIDARISKSRVFYPLLSLITFIGFMTHYYFFIWLFFLAAFYNLRDLYETRKCAGILRYALTMVITFVICYVFYPAFPAQMFKGQRGAQATGNFFDLTNTLDRLGFFFEKENRIGFSGLLVVLILISAISFICALWIRKKNGKDNSNGIVSSDIVILLLSSICYFAVVSKTALMLGDSSIRYQMPVIDMLYISLIAVSIYSLVFVLKNTGKEALCGKALYVTCVFLVIIAANNLRAYPLGNISFLYPEEKANLEILKEYSDCEVVYAYDPGQTWCVWDAANELITRDEIYFVDGSAPDVSEDQKICKSDRILLYVDIAMDKDKAINNIIDNTDKISTYTELFSADYYTVYVCE